jgi:hypothetical protein
MDRHSLNGLRPVLPCLVVCGLILVTGCRTAPQRVSSSDGRCSVVMPDPPKYKEGTAIVAGVALKEQSWGVTPDDLSSIDRPTDVTAYVLRRATAPDGTASVGPLMLGEASRRFAQALQNQGSEQPTVRPITTPAGPAVEVRASVRGSALVLAARFYTVPNGYCEVAILGARSDAEVTAFLDTVEIKP